MTNDNEPLLTVDEVAQRLRVSKMTVYRLIHAGEFPAARFGRSFRVEQGHVRDFIQRQQMPLNKACGE